MVCMKFYHKLPVVMLLLCLGFDVVVAIATVNDHCFAVVAKEENDRFRKFWKFRLFSNLGRRQLKACIPTAICVGPFFVLQRSTILRTVCEVANMVVTLFMVDR